MEKEILGGNIDLESAIGTTITDPNKIRAYRIAVGKERNNLYKSVAYDTNYGYEIIIDDSNNPITSGSKNISRSSPSEVYKVEFELSITKEGANNMAELQKPVADMDLINGNNTVKTATVSTSSTSLVPVVFDDLELTNANIKWKFSDDLDSYVNVYSIKVYYK